ncbi:MAG TPA: acyl-CoA dehydrogenase, partial [Acidimicrobiales bacterium]|nr:acyl-CoA dehydrogenase [Acidimicrobiales bacterium]
SFAALYAKESTPERVRAAEPLGFDGRLWEQLVGAGVLSMAVPEAGGGWGASLLDLELVAEQHGRALGSAPLLETQVACRLLAGAGAPAATILDDALAGRRLVTLSPRPPRDGVARLVPAGAVATDLIVLEQGSLKVVPVGQDRCVPANVGSMPLADVPLAASAGGGTLISQGEAAARLCESALDEWLVLTAAALVGIAGRSVEIGVAYAGEREAFGQKIGGFQAVGHRLADCATNADGARLLAREAAWSFDEEPSRSAELAAMAFAFAAVSARTASDWSLHFHGGYGFMLEYDIQLYYRRARAWANVLMSPAAARRRVADLRYGPRTSRAAGAWR